MLSIRITAVAAATLLLGCSSDSTGVSPDAPMFSSVQGETLPFTAHLEGAARDPSGVTCPVGSFAGSFSLAGDATHLGDLTGAGSGCTAFTSPTTFIFLSAHNTLVAANGDELWFTLVSGGGAVTGFDPTTGPVLSWSAVKDITGGTGRFAGATGRVTEVGTQAGTAAPSLSIFEGTISRLGSN